jgi:hypothetical protein
LGLAPFILAAAQATELYKAAGPYADLVLTRENSEMNAADTNSYTHTLRITFSYDGPKLEIIGVQRVAMRAPAPATITPQIDQTGYWLEVRDGDGRLLYHRSIHDPTHRHIESYGDAPGPMRLHPATATKGEFEVLVPDLPSAKTFRVHGPRDSAAETSGALAPSSAAGTRGAFAPSDVLSEHSFDDLRRRSGVDAGQGGRQ